MPEEPAGWFQGTADASHGGHSLILLPFQFLEY
jgi:hypothetical protein